MTNIPLDRRLTPEEYISLRVDDQLRYFESNSAKNKYSFYTAQTLAIIGAAAVPVLLNFADAYPILQQIAAVTGGATAVISSMLTLRKQQEMWIKYRTTAENLQREKFTYLARTGVYAPQMGESAAAAEERAFQTLVLQIESVLSTENSGWGKFIAPENNNQ